MENASKALLFAAGILIAIILITIAVSLVNTAQNSMKGVSSSMSELERSRFNSKVQQYNGTITGSEVKNFISVVNSNNVENEGTDLIIQLETDSTTAKVISKDSDSSDNCPQYTCTAGIAKRYKVTLKKDNGVYVKFDIEDAK